MNGVIYTDSQCNIQTKKGYETMVTKIETNVYMATDEFE